MFQIKPLGVDLQKIACAELGEVPGKIPDILNAFKQWIQGQPHLVARTDDQLLIQFLRNCNYDLGKAKEKFDCYYALKSKYPNFFTTTNVDDRTFRDRHNLGCFVALPTPLNDSGPRIFVFRFNYSFDQQRIEDVFLPAIAQLEVMMMNDPYTCIHGAVFITDLAKATTNHLLQITPAFLKPLFKFFDKALPINIRSYCYVNAPTYAEQFLKVLRSCMSEKLRKRVFVCGQDIKSITDRVPLKYLPKEFGGDNGSLDQLCLDHNKIWDERRQLFMENAKYGADESLRPGGPKQYGSEFGIGGSFEELNVD